MKPYLTRTVIVLSFVSFFTDIASEMVYPIFPLYLESIGFSLIGIGFLEGFAGVVTGLSKGVFGSWSDTVGKRLPFVRSGYLVSALSKPLIGLTGVAWIVFGARTADRLGKGIRTAPRDALLADESAPEHRAKVFNFHRGLDTLGAAVGPAVALVFLYFHPAQYADLFIIALIPGLISVSLLYAVREKQRSSAPKPTFRILGVLAYWRTASPAYKKILTGILIFMFFNSSDFFILLKCKELGMSDQVVIGAYIGYNLIYALTAFPIGKRADMIGMRPVYVTGLLIFALVYAGISFAENQTILFGLLALYGLYTASTEGIAKAWISVHIPSQQRGAGLGLYVMLQSFAMLFASVCTGFLWDYFSSGLAFVVSAAGALLAFIYFMLIGAEKQNK